MTVTSVPMGFRRARAIFLDRVRLDARLTPASRLVCAEITLHLNHEKDAAYPSHQFLADRLGISYRTVKRSVAEIEKCGVLEVEHRRVYQGQKNYYRAPGIAALMSQGQVAAASPRPLPSSARRLPQGPPQGPKVHFTGAKMCISQGPKVPPESSSMNLQRENLHQHQHPHPLGGVRATTSS